DIANDLDQLSLTRDGQTAVSRVRFDLDLPSAAEDDAPVGPGIPLPEWDYRKSVLLPDHCRLQPMIARDAGHAKLPHELAATARPGIPRPEWDSRKSVLLPDHCRLQPMIARAAGHAKLPDELAATARKLRGQFAALAPQRRWLKAQADGSELDVDACVRNHADRASGRTPETGGYLPQARCERDLACLLL